MSESTKTRMAGSDEFQEELSNAARNKQIREEIGNDPDRLSTRLEGVDRDAYDFTGFSDKEINMAFQGGEFGDKDYARLTGISDDDSSGGGNGSGGDSGSGNTGGGLSGFNPSINSAPSMDMNPSYPESPFGGSAQQNIQQDNDISTIISGDNNTVDNFQDNSIRQGLGSSDYGSRYARGLKDQYVLNLLNR